MVESGSSRSRLYTPGERAWWTSCFFRATHAYASKNARIRELLELAPEAEFSEDDVLRAAKLIYDRFPITWFKDLSAMAKNIQLDEVSKKTREILVNGRLDLGESGLEARRLLGIEYEDIRTKRHRVLGELESFLFAKYDQQNNVSP